MYAAERLSLMYGTNISLVKEDKSKIQREDEKKNTLII